MQKDPRQKTQDANTERTASGGRQPSPKAVPEPEPVKEHGQPGWREVKSDE